jgi:hypothetical protein
MAEQLPAGLQRCQGTAGRRPWACHPHFSSEPPTQVSRCRLPRKQRTLCYRTWRYVLHSFKEAAQWSHGTGRASSIPLWLLFLSPCCLCFSGGACVSFWAMITVTGCQVLCHAAKFYSSLTLFWSTGVWFDPLLSCPQAEICRIIPQGQM